MVYGNDRRTDEYNVDSDMAVFFDQRGISPDTVEDLTQEDLDEWRQLKEALNPGGSMKMDKTPIPTTEVHSVDEY